MSQSPIRRAGLVRLSVGRQLAIAFAAVLLLTAVVGAVSLDSLRRVQAQADALAAKWLQGVGHVAQARAAVLDMRDFEVRHSRSTDRSYHAEYEAKMAESGKSADEAMAAYIALLVTDEERALAEAFAKHWGAYRQAAARVVSLGAARKQQDAADISDGAASMALDELLMSLAKVSEYTFAGGAAAAEQSKRLYGRAIATVAGLIALALLLGGLFAWAIGRGLMRQLGGEPRFAASVVQKVAEGDLGTPITLRAGDTHSLLAQVSVMQARLAEAVTAVRMGAEGVASASVQIAQGNRDLSVRTEQQACALQGTASTMDELGATVRTNADSARQASQLAVVAAEVRSLAQRSADAARQIKGLIGTSVTRVETGTGLVSDAGRTMVEIVESIQRVTDIVGEISTASAEQSAGVAQVGESVARMDESTQQNAALVEQSAAAADSLSRQAEELVRAVGVFRLAKD
ncbi:MAG: MCP four helix bundle domain-containing protein [Burkholderiales bacterium]|nr:MCP four helix bundle domain-containing protein [Burkholderiales bacterium]